MSVAVQTHSVWPMGGEDIAPPHHDTSRRVANLLALLRFLFVAVGVTLIVVLQPAGGPDPLLVFLITGAATLSLAFAAIGTRLSATPRIAQPLLVADAMLASVGIVAGGGFDSPFLLYALAPALTASLLFGWAFAFALAVTPAVIAASAHTVWPVTGRFAWILDGNYLTLAPVYAAACLAVALLPFYANLNLRRAEQERARRAEQRLLRAELHDKLAQSMSALTMGLRQLQRVGGHSGPVGELVGVSERSYRELCGLLDLLEAGSWQPAAGGTLRRLVEAWEEETGIPVTAVLPEGDLSLPLDVTIAVLGVVREALTNAGKHSAATAVWVEVQQTPEAMEVAVRDNGRGFAGDRPAGHGRRIMQERADAANVALTVESAPGQGTQVRLRYPKN
ncbi:MAG: ATP-binding protein [Dehalococcoidia bacterium]